MCIVVVMDDIWSVLKYEVYKWCGIVGDFVVFKVVGVVVEVGYDLDDVECVVCYVNVCICFFGVVFIGCMLFGVVELLFIVLEGWMVVGLGIYGEFGIDEVDVFMVDGFVDLFVEVLLEECFDGVEFVGVCVVLLFNGFGFVKYEEFFVVYWCVYEVLVL